MPSPGPLMQQSNLSKMESFSYRSHSCRAMVGWVGWAEGVGRDQVQGGREEDHPQANKLRSVNASYTAGGPRLRPPAAHTSQVHTRPHTHPCAQRLVHHVRHDRRALFINVP